MIWDVFPGSGFFHLGSGFFHPGSRGSKKHRIRIRNTAKKISSGFCADPDVKFFNESKYGSRKGTVRARDTGTGTGTGTAHFWNH
jgi:hypothetical protein